MDTGRAVLVLAFGVVILALVAALAHRRRVVLYSLWAAAGLITVAMGLLLHGLIGHDFSYSYVVRHSSRDLPLAYRLAALWAGQEGTLLLWSLMLLGVALGLLRQRRATVGEAGLVTAGVLGFLALLLLRSPFAVVEGVVPADGQGLNPLLRNPWMLVHPPVLFVGYALLAAPAALAFGGLARRDWDGWLSAARPWLLLGWAFLGAGMMLGGYWAYITLGWGGFWAWDPVENSSLIPWLFATALLHGAPLQRRHGAFRHLNAVLVLLSYVAVIYGSYLTRSGVLGEASVHSFESLGADYNSAWLVILLLPLLAGLTLLAKRWREMPAAPVPAGQTWLAQGVWAIAVMAVFVLIGTSAPLISSLYGEPVAVDPSFYNRTQTVLFGLCALLVLRQMRPGGRLLPALMALFALGAGALAATLIGESYPPQVRAGLVVAAALAGGMALVAGERAWRAGREARWAAAAPGLAHGGLALLVLGAILSGPGQRVEQVVLAPGKSQEVLGATLSLEKVEQTADEKTLLHLGVEQNGRRASATARMFETANGQMRNPALVHAPLQDLYLEPQELTAPAASSPHGAHQGAGHGGKAVVIKKGETKTIDGLVVTFEAFEMHGSHGDGETIAVGAKLRVGKGTKAKTVVPQFVMKAEGPESPPEQVAGRLIALGRVLADTGSVELLVSAASKPAAKADKTDDCCDDYGTAPGGARSLTLVATTKPAIGLVWIGSLLLIASGLVSLVPGRPALGLATIVPSRKEGRP